MITSLRVLLGGVLSIVVMKDAGVAGIVVMIAQIVISRTKRRVKMLAESVPRWLIIAVGVAERSPRLGQYHAWQQQKGQDSAKHASSHWNQRLL